MGKILAIAPSGLPWLSEVHAALRASRTPPPRLILLAEEGRCGSEEGVDVWPFQRTLEGKIRGRWALFRKMAMGRFDLICLFVDGDPKDDPLEILILSLLPAAHRLIFSLTQGTALRVSMGTPWRTGLTRPLGCFRQARRRFLKLLWVRGVDPAVRIALRALPVFWEPICRVAGRRRGMALGEVRRLLFIALDNPGDVLLTTPVLSALKGRFPWATLAVLAGEWSRELLEGHPAVAKVIPYNAPWFSPYVRHLPHSRMRPARDLARCLKLLWRERFDMIVETRGEAAHVALGYLTGASIRAGYCLRSVVPWLRADHLAHLLTHRIPYAWDRWEEWHRVDYNMQVAIHLGASPTDSSLVLPIPTQARQKMQRLLEGHGVREDTLLVGVHPGASRERKRWPSHRFAQVLDHLIERWGARVVMLGSSQERALAEELARWMAHPPILAAGQTTLVEAAALIQRCRLVICNDSLMTHIASAVKTPVVVVSRAPSNFYAPYRTKGISLTHRLSCMNRGMPDGCICPFTKQWCLQEVTSEEVIKAAEDLLRCESVLIAELSST